MANVVVKEDEVTIPKEPLLRYNQREELKAEVESLDLALHPMNPFRHKNSIDAQAASSRARILKKQLTENSPKELPGGAKDKIAKRCKEIEEKIVNGMPTQEEMRKNPAGMVDRWIKWEKAFKKEVLEWKNGQIMLEPDSSDKDLANFERLRPEGQMDRFRGDAQINGHMSYGNIPEWVWERIFQSTPNSALEQVKKVEAEIKETEKIDKRTLPRTEEQKRILTERLASARAAKGGMNDPVSPSEGESVPFEGA
jgi:hypothetical protein